MSGLEGILHKNKEDVPSPYFLENARTLHLWHVQRVPERSIPHALHAFPQGL
jgi:hypothetical protein